MYDYHPDLVCIFFLRSHPYILLHFEEMFFITCFRYNYVCVVIYAADMQVDICDIKFDAIIGRGSFAVVYRKAWRARQVALKCVSVPDSVSAGIPKEVQILRYGAFRRLL